MSKQTRPEHAPWGGPYPREPAVSSEQQLSQLREANRQLEIERDDYKAVYVAREAGYIIERVNGRWYWRVQGFNPRGPFPHQFAAARDAVGEAKP